MTGADTPVYTSETYTTVNKAFGAPFTIQVDGTYELRYCRHSEYRQVQVLRLGCSSRSGLASQPTRTAHPPPATRPLPNRDDHDALGWSVGLSSIVANTSCVSTAQPS